MPHGPDGDDRHVRRGRRGREGRQGRQGRDRPGIDQLMERVRQLDADLATELESTARQNPQEFRGYFARNVARQLGRLLGEGRKHGMAGEDGRKKVEEAALLELRTGLAGYRMRSMNEGERAGARAGLQKDLERLFDLKMELQQQRVKQTEEKLAELKKTLAARQKNRSSIVTGRMEDLVGQEDRFGW